MIDFSILAAYLAGFVDGEGCIQILRGPYHSLTVTIAQKDPVIIHALRACLGGHFNTQRHGMHAWRLHADQAKEFLRFVRPFLGLKREQAELGIMFQSMPWRGLRRGARGRYRSKNAAQYEIDENFNQVMHWEKKSPTWASYVPGEFGAGI